MSWPHVTNAEFDRHLEKMNRDTLGAGALARHLLADIGKIDARGRPDRACSLWWFIAHLEPTATRITGVREELVTALRRGEHGHAEVQRIADRWLGDARDLLRHEPQIPAEQHRLLSSMLDEAAAALRGWAKDPGFLGNDFFTARPAAGREFTSRDFNVRGARLYSTRDDLALEASGRPASPRPAQRSSPSTPARVKSPATSADAPVARLRQRDAVRALLAADVLEMVGDGPASPDLLEGLGGAAAETVADLHALKGDRRALFATAMATVSKEYLAPDALGAADVAQSILRKLGVDTRQVRAFRAALAGNLLRPADAALPAPVGGRSFTGARAELVALVEDIEGRGRVDADDVRAVEAFTDSLDLASIEDGEPGYVTLLQRIFYVAGMDTPESAELEPIYYHALNTHRAKVAARAKAQGFLPWAEARQTFLDWVEAKHADAEAIRDLVSRLDPSDVKAESNFLNAEIGVLALHRFGVSNDGAAEAFRRPLWDLVNRIAKAA